MEREKLLSYLTDLEKKILVGVEKYFEKTKEVHPIQQLKTEKSTRNEHASFYFWFTSSRTFNLSPNKKVIGTVIKGAAAKACCILNEDSFENIMLTYTRCRKLKIEDQLNRK